MTNSIEKEFATWDDVMAHRSNCPYCLKEMKHRGDNLSYRHQSIAGYTMIDNTLSYNCILNLKDKTIEYKETPNQQITSGGVGPNGTLYLSIVYQCTECNEYQFVIKAILDLTNKTIKHFFLSSETFLIENKTIPGNIFNVKVIYSFNEIEVCQIRPTGAPIIGSRFILPMFNLDITNREAALKSLGAYATFL